MWFFSSNHFFLDQPASPPDSLLNDSANNFIVLAVNHWSLHSSTKWRWRVKGEEKTNTSPYKYYGSGNIYTFHAFHVSTGFSFAHFWHFAISFHLYPSIYIYIHPTIHLLNFTVHFAIFNASFAALGLPK